MVIVDLKVTAGFFAANVQYLYLTEFAVKDLFEGGVKMFRPMRRKNQELSQELTDKLLQTGTAGVLAVAGDDGYPYAVPISYAYDKENQRFLFHTAKEGHKIDAFLREPKVSFCVIDKATTVAKEYTSYFRSAVAFGKMQEITGDERVPAMMVIGKKYCSEYVDGMQEYIEKALNRIRLWELKIEHLTGKESIELVQMRQKGENVD